MSYTVKFLNDDGNSSSFGPLMKVLEARSAAWTMVNRLNGKGHDFEEVPTSLTSLKVYEWVCPTKARIWVEED